MNKLSNQTQGSWQIAQLNDICTLINGRAYKKKELLAKGKYPVLRVGNFFSNKSWYYSDLELATNKYCDNGDLLYAWSASFGPRIWQEEKVIYHYHIWKVEIDPSKVAKKFLYYWFDWDKEKIKAEQGAGTTMIHVTKGSMENRLFRYPSLPEQKRIVAILDEAFAGIDQAIANTEKNLANAHEVFESYLNGVFTQKGGGWADKKLSEILETGPRNGWSPPAKNHSDKGTPVVSLSSVTGFEFNLSKIKFTSAPVKPEAHYWLENDALLITRSNTPELVGHVAVCSGLKEPIIYPDLIMKMMLDKDVADTRFIYYQLRSKKLRELIMNSAQGANPTMKKINKSVVQNLPISLPSLQKQETIVERIDAIRKETRLLESIYQKKLTALAELKQSILHKAFTGELTQAPEQKLAEVH